MPCTCHTGGVVAGCVGDGAATGAVAAANGVTAGEADDMDATHYLGVVVVGVLVAAAYSGLEWLIGRRCVLE